MSGVAPREMPLQSRGISRQSTGPAGHTVVYSSHKWLIFIFLKILKLATCKQLTTVTLLLNVGGRPVFPFPTWVPG